MDNQLVAAYNWGGLGTRGLGGQGRVKVAVDDKGNAFGRKIPGQAGNGNDNNKCEVKKKTVKLSLMSRRRKKMHKNKMNKKKVMCYLFIF